MACILLHAALLSRLYYIPFVFALHTSFELFGVEQGGLLHSEKGTKQNVLDHGMTELRSTIRVALEESVIQQSYGIFEIFKIIREFSEQEL